MSDFHHSRLPFDSSRAAVQNQKFEIFFSISRYTGEKIFWNGPERNGPDRAGRSAVTVYISGSQRSPPFNRHHSVSSIVCFIH